MALTYDIFGLRVRCDKPLPGVLCARDPEGIDVQVSLNCDPANHAPAVTAARHRRYVSEARDDGGSPALTVSTLADDGFEFHYSDGTRFVMDGAGTRIRGDWPAPLTAEDAAIYLLGPILAFALRLRGITCLHASAFEIDGGAVALVGPAGAGKSTTAALFAANGYAVLSDDVVAVTVAADDLFVARPAYPRVGLWDDSVAALFGVPDVLPTQTSNWNKRYLDLMQPGYTFRARSLPLRALYILGERVSDPSAPFVRPVARAAALISLIENAYVNYLLDGPMRARDFGILGRLVERVPVRQVVPHADSALLPRLLEVVVDDVRQLSLR